MVGTSRVGTVEGRLQPDAAEQDAQLARKEAERAEQLAGAAERRAEQADERAQAAVETTGGSRSLVTWTIGAAIAADYLKPAVPSTSSWSDKRTQPDVADLPLLAPRRALIRGSWAWSEAASTPA